MNLNLQNCTKKIHVEPAKVEEGVRSKNTLPLDQEVDDMNNLEKEKPRKPDASFTIPIEAHVWRNKNNSFRIVFKIPEGAGDLQIIERPKEKINEWSGEKDE